MKRTTIIETIVFLYAVLFIYTGISKLIEYGTLKEQLAESPMLALIAPVVAVTLPLIEFLAVLLLVIPRWRLKGLYLALGMMIVFTIYIIALLSFSDKLPCSCGGVIAALSWPQHVVFNSAFIILATIGIIQQKRKKKEQQKTWNSIIQNASI
jgi:uncharacterized membrane protein YphA (DoxX/SURF4 family)